jgi:nitric oxide reductase large subunit
MSVMMLPYAAALMWIALKDYGTVSVDQWILIMDGVLITSAGMTLAPAAPFIKSRTVYGTLAVLWMLLGLFDFGYVLQPYGKWAELNDSLLPVMVIGAFGWIALKTRWVGRLQRQSHI